MPRRWQFTLRSLCGVVAVLSVRPVTDDIQEAAQASQGADQKAKQGTALARNPNQVASVGSAITQIRLSMPRSRWIASL